MKVNILLLTINRFDITRFCIGEAMKNAGHPFELCITDNGSTDKRIIEWAQELNPLYHKVNGYNQGTPQALNEMIEKNPADAWVFLGNDIRLPANWLADMVTAAKYVNQLGVVGVNWRPMEYEQVIINGVPLWKTERVFGDMFITNKLRQKIGRFCEDYGVYGFWDSDYSIRAGIAGRPNYYLADKTSLHEGDDVGQNNPYRKMKDEALAKGKEIWMENWKRYEATKEVYI